MGSDGASGGKVTPSDFTDVFVYLAVFSFFFIVLHKLLKDAKKEWKKEVQHPKQDEFIKENGYSFDFVLVFAVHDESAKQNLSKTQRKFSMKKVISNLIGAGVETSCFYSCQRDEIYVKLRVPPNRLKKEADRINYRLKLNFDRLRTKAQTGKPGVWAKIDITDNYNISNYRPFDFIYAEYKSTPEVQALYETYPVHGSDGKMSIFRGVDRIKLLISIMEAKKYEGGAGLHLTNMLVKEAVLAGFPLHEYEELNMLQELWLVFFQQPQSQPVEAIKDYFGERIGLYFVYLGYSCDMLKWMAFFGLFSFIFAKVRMETESPVMPVFAVVMVVWSTIFIEYWKQKQITTAMMWGVIGFEAQERDRPQFTGMRIKSPVDGSDFVYFREDEKARRGYIVMFTVSFAIACVIFIVGCTFALQWYLNRPNMVKHLTVLHYNTTSIITPLINSIVIAVLNTLYDKVVYILNDYENHRTDTDYEDSLVSKVFVFQLVNSFAALTYVSFIKTFLGIQCTYEMCTYDVGTTLSTVFLTRLVSQVIVEVFVRKVSQHMKTQAETEGLEPGVEPTPIEQQYFLSEYDALVGSLKDYAALTIQYGYTILFVTAFPLAPTLAFCMTYLKIRIDGWKLCQAHRRPIPKTAEDIGMWEAMVDILSNLSIISNFGLIFYTAQYMIDITWAYRWIMFILCEHAIFSFRAWLAMIIDDEPDDVKMQREREEFLVSKVMKNEEDDLGDVQEEAADAENVNVIIDSTDYSYESEFNKRGSGGGTGGGDYEMTPTEQE